MIAVSLMLLHSLMPVSANKALLRRRKRVKVFASKTYVYIYIYIHIHVNTYIYIYIYTHPTYQNNILFEDTKSGAEEQFLLLDCRAKARTKGVKQILM